MKALQELRELRNTIKAAEARIDQISNQATEEAVALAPNGGTREAYTEENFQSMGTWHYHELSLFDAATAKPRLEAWDKFLKENYPEIKPNHLVRMYHLLPFRLYFAWFKTHNFNQRVLRFLKRKLKALKH